MNINDELNEYKDLLESAIEEINSYLNKSMKSKSLRIRKLSNQIGKDGKILRASLLAADKA